MDVAVIGGTGIAGGYAVEALRADGCSVHVLSRSTGVDVCTGVGLEPALAGVDVVVDATNSTSLRRAAATRFFEQSAGQLQRVAKAQGVRHIVLLSIVGLERVHGYGYYDAKLAQERAAMAGDVPVTVLRATQFHEFPAQILARLHLGRFAVVPHMRSRPVAARTVGVHLARLVAERPGDIVELAGPEVHDVVDMARRIVNARDERQRVLAVAPPGKAFRDIRGGALLAGATTILDGPTFDEWLRSPDAQRVQPGAVAAPQDA
jgi:uncharacterized protein YbjT (DUF2867 family)